MQTLQLANLAISETPATDLSPAAVSDTNSLSPLKDRAVSLLGQNIRASIVASTIGVDPSYITQLLEDPIIAQQIAQLRAVDLEKNIKRDAKRDSVEDAALKIVESRLPLVRSPLEAARIFQILNSAKRKSTDTGAADSNAGVAQVTIILPKAAADVYLRINNQNQVIEVSGETMAPLPSRNLHSLARSKSSVGAIPTEITDATPAAVKKDVDTAKNLLAGMADFEAIVDGVRVVL